jgi:hypothetical protein
MKTHRIHLSLLTAVLLSCAPLAWAASAPAQPLGAQNTPMTPMHGQTMHDHAMHMKGHGYHSGMMGVHNMPAKVTAVDHSTGIVKLDSLGMHLVVHFPPPTIKELKAGDHISLHLGYRLTGK